MLQRIRDAKKNQSGFTLIELLIVIVILGVLAAVVVLAVGAFNNNGKSAACQSDFKSYEIADEAFYAKSSTLVGGPFYATDTSNTPGVGLGPYLKEIHQNLANGYTINLSKTSGVSVTVAGAPTTDITACSSLGG